MKFKHFHLYYSILCSLFFLSFFLFIVPLTAFIAFYESRCISSKCVQHSPIRITVDSFVFGSEMEDIGLFAVIFGNQCNALLPQPFPFDQFYSVCEPRTLVCVWVCENDSREHFKFWNHNHNHNIKFVVLHPVMHASIRPLKFAIMRFNILSNKKYID